MKHTSFYRALLTIVLEIQHGLIRLKPLGGHLIIILHPRGRGVGGGGASAWKDGKCKSVRRGEKNKKGGRGSSTYLIIILLLRFYWGNNYRLI